MRLKKLSNNFRNIAFLLSMFFVILTSAQNQKTVFGTVMADGAPLPGSSVVVKGTTNGTATDFDGKFSLSVSSSATTLEVSYLGYVTQEVAITSGEIAVVLVAENNTLDEVIINVGYGSQLKSKVSGAISTIKTGDVEKLKPVRVEEALQGRASGATVIQTGSPGSKPTILIRGIPSFSGVDPVVVVDGSIQTLSDLNSINSADIESINVLKDAASTSIYGVKGGNGVILVTTKSGKKNQKTEVIFSSNFGYQSVIKQIDMLNATEYAAILNEGSVAAGGSVLFSDLSALGKGTNWQDEIFHNASILTQNVTAKGGGEGISYFLSGGYLGQDGIVGGGDKSDFNRLNFTANIDFDISKKIKFIANTSFVNIKSKGVAENAFNSIIGSALNYDPTVSVYNTNPNTVGEYGFSTLLLSEIFNPLTKLQNTYNKSNGNKLYGKLELQYDIIKDLKFTSRFGYVKWDQVGKNFYPLVFYGLNNVDNSMNADGTTVTGKHNSVNEYNASNFNFTYENYFNYGFDLKEKHSFDFVLGMSISKSTGSGFSVSRQDVPFNSWSFADVSAATGVNSTTNLSAYTGSSYQNLTRKNVSYFGRVNYDYDDKYLASFSARRDGSFAFGTDNKFAVFYAGSLGWVVSNEDFFKSKFINNLKIRGSFGTVGNENVDPQVVKIDNTQLSYSNANNNGYTFGSTFVAGATVGNFANNELRWEKQKQMNAGFDISVLNNKLSLSADYFMKTVDGLLFSNPSSLYGGTSSNVQSNIGSTESKGIDLTLSFNHNPSDKFKINTSVTFTTADNKVTETNSDGTAYYTGGGYFNGQSQTVTRFEKGFTPGYFYGYKTDGLFQNVDEIASSPTQTNAQPGDIKFVDVDKDGSITTADKTQIGDPFPDFTLGWNFGVEYKNIDFSVFTYASVGNDVYKAFERNAQYSNKPATILNRWTGEGSTNDSRYPRYTFTDTNNNSRVSDRYVEDGSFVKIKNLVIGYSLPSSVYKSGFVDKLRVYLQVKNLYTFTKYSGYDPEIAGGILDSGIDRGSYPQARTISVGLDVKF